MIEKSSASISVYEQIKDLIRNGVFIPGDKLQAKALGRRFRFSHIPAREAFERLAGEGLLDHTSQIGFMVPAMNPIVFRQLLDWQFHLLTMAIMVIFGSKLRLKLGAEKFERSLSAGRYEDDTERFFYMMAQRSENIEIIQAVSRANNKLHWARMNEQPYVYAPDDELDTLISAWNRRDHEDLIRELSVFRARRHVVAYEITQKMMVRNCEYLPES